MTKKLWAGVILAAICVPTLIAAAEIRTGEQPSLASNEKINDDFYIAGGNVSSAGAITGDLIAMGGNVLITSAVSEDVMVGGGSVTILGTVGDDVRIGGGNITISGQVRGDVVVGGGQTQISGPGVGGDVLWGGGTLRIEAPVTGDLKLGGGDVYINAPVKGNVRFEGDKLTLGKAAVIEGSLSYKSPNEVTLEEGAVVRGATTYEPRADMHQGSKGGIIAFLSLALLVKFLMTLVCALIFGLIFHKYALTMVEHATSRPLLEMGRGFAALVITPIASIILLISVLGLPFGLLGLVAFAGMIIFAMIAAPIVLGSVVHRWTMKPGQYEVTWLTIFIGAVLYTLLGWIPIIGWIVKFVVILITIGAAMKIKWDIVKNWR